MIFALCVGIKISKHIADKNILTVILRQWLNYLDFFLSKIHPPFHTLNEPLMKALISLFSEFLFHYPYYRVKNTYM